MLNLLDSEPAAEGSGDVVDDARAVFRAQAEAIAHLADRVGSAYLRAVELMHASEGHVVATGMGKSGIVARKVAATLASTGTPSFFLHSADAGHGDLGAVTSRDVMLMISCSGETEEALRLLPCLEELEIPIVALVGDTSSTLARRAHSAIDVSVQREVCPHNLAPTTSAMAALAMGDALAVSLMRRRNFAVEGFARVHPGGRLARRAQPRVKDLMRTANLPRIGPAQPIAEALLVLSEGRVGMALVMEGKRLVGTLSDRDVRASMVVHGDTLKLPVSSVMSPPVATVRQHAPLTEAERLTRELAVDTLVVVDDHDNVCGIIDGRFD